MKRLSFDGMTQRMLMSVPVIALTACLFMVSRAVAEEGGDGDIWNDSSSDKTPQTKKPDPVDQNEAGQDAADSVAVVVASNTKDGNSDNCCEWIKKYMAFAGDVRIRQSSDFNDDPNIGDRHRQMIRMRFRLKYRVSNSWSFGVGVTTGNPTTPENPYQTLGTAIAGTLDNFYISFDEAFVSWQPENLQKANRRTVTFLAGKFRNIFYQNPVNGNLTMDEDIHPEGVVMHVRQRLLDFLPTLDIFAGHTVLQERANDADTTSENFQVVLRQDVQGFYLKYSAKYQHYSAITPGAAPAGDLLSENFLLSVYNENNTFTGGDFASDFGIWDTTIVMYLPKGFNLFGLLPSKLPAPFAFSLEWIYNSRRAAVASKDDTGYAIGVRYGERKKKGDYVILIQTMAVRRDAVLAPLVQDDLIYRTNHRTNILAAQYQVQDKVWLQLYMARARHIDNGGVKGYTVWLLRFDVTVEI